MKRWNVATVRSSKGSEKLGCCTAYDACFARLADEAGVPIVLVGDSMGMNALGYATTLPVNMSDTLAAVGAVSRAVTNALVVGDMPFGSYQCGDDKAVENAVAIIKQGADAVKLEGGASVCGLIRRLTTAGIPVLAHVGMTPQSVNEYGGFKRQGKTREEAERMYDVYMADPDTPAEVKKAKRAAIVRMLAQRAADRYDTVQTNSVATWEFPADIAAGPVLARFKFTNMFDMRADVRGRIVFGEATGCVSNITRTAVVVPLEGDGSSGTRMTFENLGSDALMFRPRQDVELLVAADGFTENLFRCLAELVAILALIVAFGVFLGAGLSRPVALFTGMIVLAAGEISPSVIDQYPDKMETDRIDRIGLVITRAVERITRPVGSLSPLGRLADDDCVEAREVLSAFGYDFVLLPIMLSLIAGFLISRKCE